MRCAFSLFVQSNLSCLGGSVRCTESVGVFARHAQYMNVKLAELKKADPSLAHKEAFQKAFDAWKVRETRILGPDPFCRAGAVAGNTVDA